MSKKIYRAENGMPLVVYVVEPTEGITKNVLIYGHLDKQPYGDGWVTDPCDPVIKGELMYGRGASDDGYAPFSAMLAIKAGQDQGVPMPRCAVVLEAEEESGSPNLIGLLKQASDFIGVPDYAFCMDSGAFDYNQLWITSSLRGVCITDMQVEIGAAGYHSGEVGGVVPETFRVVRQLLDRLDDVKTGTCCKELNIEVPEWKQKEAEFMSALSGPEMHNKYGVVEGAGYCNQDNLVAMYLANTWESNLSITGADGLPAIQMAGNVVRASTSVRLSMRLPPAMDPQEAKAIIEKKLTTDVPYNAKVTLTPVGAGSGWCMKVLSPELDKAIKEAGAAFYDGKETGSYGMGGSIPFLSELGTMYPKTEIVAFGLLGPNSNAHGPNEMIHLGYAKRLTSSLAHIIQSVAN
jgi:acetylornithine deacetylase/succinyl-diaminopimelate desuccinylase-like protein